MNGQLTGININQVTADLKAFREAADNIVQKLSDASNTFGTIIVHNWSSPKAVEFAHQYSYKMVDIFIEPKKAFDAILNDAAIAASKMASANGASFDPMNYFPMPYTMFYGHSALDDVVEAAPGGEVGMNVDVVKAALEEFSSKVSQALALTDSLPRNIALYDSTGSLQASFSSRISDAVNKVNEVVSSITSAINASATTEANTIISGVQTSIEAMMSGN